MRTGWVRLWLGVALAALGCGDDDDEGVADGGEDASVCEAPPPDTPAILAPAPTRAGVLPVLARDLVLQSTPMTAGAGQEHAATEIEIWALDGGEPTERVWLASLSDAARLTEATLADGVFEGSAAAAGALAAWDPFAVRVRYGVTLGDCRGWSEWSAYAPFRSDDGSEEMFDPETIREVRLEIPPDSWAAIDAQAVGPWPYVPERTYHAGTLDFEGQVFEGVGIRVKGGCGSSRDLSGKAGFKVSLKWDDPDVPGCPEERRLFGQTHVTLNNGIQDPSFERERLGYLVYRAMGVPTPRAAHVHLHVNDEDWGPYLHLESIDRRFLKRWFPSSDGMMYEGSPGCDVVPEQVPPLGDAMCWDMEFSTSACDTPDPERDPTDWALLTELARRIDALPDGGFYPEIESIFGYDELLSSWAATVVLGNWDGYPYVNNHRVYHDPSTGRWSLITTGIDNTFGIAPTPADAAAFVWNPGGVLAVRCLEEQDCKDAFVARLLEAIEVFEALDLASRAETIRAQLAPWIEADPRREYTVGASERSYLALLQFIAEWPTALRQTLRDEGY